MSNIQQTEITSEMKRAYLDYAMTVIVARALPDVRDGLKPVHRRILYAMWETGLRSSAKYRKSAAVVGEVLKSYHPHGDSPVYEALVRLAQDFVMRYPLVKGQGNFGSIDGDPPAQMRYTEVKLNPIADEMLFDIDKETVPMSYNFDSTLLEPDYLPAKLPNLLLMGAEGIAVGMATKIPPHNLTEITSALIEMIDHAKKIDRQDAEDGVKTTVEFDRTLDDIMTHVKGPDFPTGGIIYGTQDIKQAYATGKASIMVRAVVEQEESSRGKVSIIVNQLPYQVNKANLIEKIAHLVVDKKIVGIADLRDESDRHGMRIVIELKRDASYKKVLNNLYKYTDLQTTFPINVVALNDGVPQTLSLQSVLELYLYHRIDVVTKRTEYELTQAKHRAHILEGYLIALDNIDEVIEIIKKSKDEPTARTKLMERFGLSDIQSQAILDMQLKRLTGLERSKIEEELKKLRELIAYLESLLGDVIKLIGVIKQELIDIRKTYGDTRKTTIVANKPGQINDEMLIENKEVIVTFTKEGYIKQIPAETFKSQNRGGKGVSGMQTREDDNVACLVSAMTHDTVLFFSNQGRVFQTRVWDIPQGSRTSKGKAIVNLLSLRPEENVTSLLAFTPHAEAQENECILMVTKKGTVKKTLFSEFKNIRSNGIVAIKLDKGDELLWTKFTDGNMNIMLVSKVGKAIVFREDQVRPTGRSSMGVRGMNIEPQTDIAAADIFTETDLKKDIVVITSKGMGKRTNLSEFRDQNRGGKGIRIAPIDTKTGPIAFVALIEKDVNDIIITSMYGQVVKIGLKNVPTYSRNAKGVILMRMSDKDDYVSTAALV